MKESKIRNFIYKLIYKLPGIYQIKNKQIELERYQAELQHQQIELQRQQVELEINYKQFTAINEGFQINKYNSIDYSPWNHPYLTANNISRFRKYSESVWQFAMDYFEKYPEPIKCAFLDNMAQNMHKWAMLVQKYRYEVALFPNAADVSALGAPEWENFDGEYSNLLDGKNFLSSYSDIPLEIPCYRIPLEGSEFYSAYIKFCEGDRTPLLHLLKDSLCLRYEPFIAYQGVYPYYQLANALSQFDVIYGTNIPIAAYLSGKPYCVASTGGDLQFSTGLGNYFGQIMNLAFNAARFLMISNPHTLGHCRRLGLTNGLYLPYPMDDSRYFPTDGKARKEWEAKYGKGVYVLTTSRLDKEVKGQDESFFQALVNVAQQKPEIRFIFLAWGNHLAEFRQKLQSTGMENQFIILNPVGKKRLIDYYRSCDIVLDQFVYGYYGATALEAAAIGKPVIIKLRTEQYEPLYLGDVAPMLNASTPAEIAQVLLALTDKPELRQHKGTELRQWLVRNHGEEKTIPLMQALFRLTADQVPLPQDLVNPLWDDVSAEEDDYHTACQQPISS